MHTEEGGAEHTSWLYTSPPTTHLPGSLCYSSHLLPSTLRTEVLVIIGGIPTMALGNGSAMSTVHSLQGTIPLQDWKQSQHTPNLLKFGPLPLSGNF